MLTLAIAGDHTRFDAASQAATTGSVRIRWNLGCTRLSRGGSGGQSPNLRMSKAAHDVVVDHPDCLHEGVTDSGADEPEAAADEILAHRLSLERTGRNLLRRAPVVGPRPTAHEGPEVRVETAEVALNRKSRPGVLY